MTPDLADLVAAQKRRKSQLQPYEVHLKQFHYKQALTTALAARNPEVILALVEELLERGALEVALAGLSENEVEQALGFIGWKVGDYRYAGVVTEVLRVLIDMYSGVVGMGGRVDAMVEELAAKVGEECDTVGTLKEIGGQVEMLMRVVSEIRKE